MEFVKLHKMEKIAFFFVKLPVQLLDLGLVVLVEVHHFSSVIKSGIQVVLVLLASLSFGL